MYFKLKGCPIKTKIIGQFSAHVFFDDAWEDQAECGRTPNEYFKTLFNLLLELTQYFFVLARVKQFVLRCLRSTVF